MDRFSQACEGFGLIISLKKTNILGLDTPAPPVIGIDDYELDVVHKFTYLGSTITVNLSLNAEIDKKIRKAATILARITSKVWTNSKLTMTTKMTVYNACVLCTLLYCSETWTTYARQKKRLNTFHLRSLRRLLGISWQDKVTNTDVISRAGLPIMYTLLRKRRLRWLGHVYRMQDGRISKHILYGELAAGQRGLGRPQLRYKDVCKRDMKALGININSWEDLAADRTSWRSTLQKQLQTGEEKLLAAAAEKRARRKETSANRPESIHICDLCGRDCHSRIGLYSQNRRCSSRANSLDLHGQMKYAMVSHERRWPTTTTITTTIFY